MSALLDWYETFAKWEAAASPERPAHSHAAKHEGPAARALRAGIRAAGRFHCDGTAMANIVRLMRARSLAFRQLSRAMLSLQAPLGIPGPRSTAIWVLRATPISGAFSESELLFRAAFRTFRVEAPIIGLRPGTDDLSERGACNTG